MFGARIEEESKEGIVFDNRQKIVKAEKDWSEILAGIGKGDSVSIETLSKLDRALSTGIEARTATLVQKRTLVFGSWHFQLPSRRI